jgi:hypothetical protein
VAAIAGQPHFLFRRHERSRQGSHLEVSPLANPLAPRGATNLECDRVSFNGGRGICLQTRRGLMTNYEAVVFDARAFSRSRR